MSSPSEVSSTTSITSKALMVDFETLGVQPNACVTCMSFLVFDPSDIVEFDELVKNTLTIKLDWKTQLNSLGRTITDSTIDFWKKPENSLAYKTNVQEHPDDVQLSSVNEMLYHYLNKMGYDLSDNSTDKAYCRGNVFDFGMLENIYEHFNWQPLIKFWNYRDVRTEIDAIMQHVDPKHEGYGYVRNFNLDNFIKHDSAHDCARDVLMIQYAHMELINKLQGE